MKFINTEVTSCTIPGTVRDIIVFMVRKEKSSSIFQMYYMNKELLKWDRNSSYKRKLIARDSDIYKFPSLKVEATNFKAKAHEEIDYYIIGFEEVSLSWLKFNTSMLL